MLLLATMGHHVMRTEAGQFWPTAVGVEGAREGDAWMSDASEERWERCQIEREEQTGFFGSRVVYSAVHTDQSGRRRVVATQTVDRRRGSAGADWESLAERLVAGGWEQLPHAADALPSFQRRLR